ncbi:dihydroxyacetone kinase [Microbacterium testaceum StLB037]|uniref:Dihydroxyacetone kinase n=1 Tax=Microbacterium testaceum (strain StLB037) TaxID=979556 RepID=E8NDC2_MICTS|nr:dihydroxyacetone kinase family protein [Microbacterium testaceum]BAJ74980.1 dihydroxyacetone kinase [Microbacterium testaceum StLB037]
MTRLWNEPAAFADEMIDGFVAANGRYVRRIPGGVARATTSPRGQVAVVVGGGSGHYPAFGGLVGPGLAHAAAMGNLFASPSTQQVYGAARAADNGGGVFFTYGNYAGDVLNFDAAQERLRREGIDARTVTVTDDISSAPPAERLRRRGIAGDLTVFRAAAAAAERGDDLEGVTRVAALANERTRSFGVAFTGCTLPGAEDPLFTVAEGRMAVGLGIHGEQGIDETDVPTADGLAEMLVAALLDPAELPDGVASVSGARVVPILNGLGSLKYEEMFVVYRRVAQLLEEAGIEIVDPHVGEYCTSFDMAGTSLTLYWLDDELATLWEHPVDTPAYRRGAVTATDRVAAPAATVTVADEIPDADDSSRAAAQTVRLAVAAIADTIDAHVDELGRLDAVAGDGDHGIGMQRGAHAARAAADAAAEAGAGAATTMQRAADAWADRAGGTSGALWGVILAAIARALGDSGTPTAADVAAGVSAASRAVTDYGKAELGDKTLVDALVPFATTLAHGVDGGASLSAAWAAAAVSADRAASATADLLPRKGRARTHGEHAVGTPDPGAVSLALITAAVADVLATASEKGTPS